MDTSIKQPRISYDRDALRQSAKRRERNILAFNETIEKEEKFIDHYLFIITQIDPKHPDIEKLESTIRKKKANIGTFKKAIKDEKILIKQELEMATDDK